ncbi:hypothetical protein TNCV_2018331 [Trichonephila clavipes]|nr:hypothetical protein TNCV_2018331 [Trichonephila clavipes]
MCVCPSCVLNVLSRSPVSSLAASFLRVIAICFSSQPPGRGFNSPVSRDGCSCLPNASRHALLAKDLVTWQAMVGRHILEDIVGRVAQYVDEHYPVDKGAPGRLDSMGSTIGVKISSTYLRAVKVP